MKIVFKSDLDILQIQFSSEAVIESDEKKRGVIIDYDSKGNMVSIEILNASKKISQPNKVEYELA